MIIMMTPFRSLFVILLTYHDQRRMKTDLYKLSGLLAFLIAWFGMLITVFTQGKDKSKSISLHAASSKKTIVLLGVLSPLSMFLFMLFAIAYVTPLLSLSTAFVVLNILAYLGYILAAWVPATGGNKTKLHNLFSYGASLLLIPIAIMLLMSPSTAAMPKLIIGVFLVAAGFFGYLFWSRPERANFLYFQIAYFLLFDISLLAAAYIR